MASRDSASIDNASLSGFGTWLRGLREKQNVIQRHLASAADMDASHLGKIERGERFPTDEQAIAFARRLGVPISELRTRMLASKLVRDCGGDLELAHKAAALVQEEAAPYIVNKPVNTRPKKK